MISTDLINDRVVKMDLVLKLQNVLKVYSNWNPLNFKEILFYFKKNKIFE